MIDDPMSAAIVQTVLTLAAALGMEAVAEGVETAAQAEVLRAMKCGSGQGYLWSRPVEAERAFELLRPRRSVPVGARTSVPVAAA
jgi:EAL domain-containing protein (putative c-di-GMP-specific phosphodiesterase class I)